MVFFYLSHAFPLSKLATRQKKKSAINHHRSSIQEYHHHQKSTLSQTQRFIYHHLDLGHLPQIIFPSHPSKSSILFSTRTREREWNRTRLERERKHNKRLKSKSKSLKFRWCWIIGYSSFLVIMLTGSIF